jgi:hypothetical protein
MTALYSPDATAIYPVVQNIADCTSRSAGKLRSLAAGNLRLFCKMKIIVKYSPEATVQRRKGKCKKY